ncbi:hypothetical protein [Bacillus weihaiensis]|uniref:Uncharacterized protein n=1 Tax=Bacillus weihaiensis TaxID=1547283 RepID=A0A1L3MW12_9BACI|nr:hypothetical protein [Bacillus weihaiensis]APH06523.1 hypothetical protein A9C19_18315 [Bacillus weihaiensis]
MGAYKSICYKVEDAFVKLLTKKHNSEEVTQKVIAYRNEKESGKALRNKVDTLKRGKERIG